MPELANLLLYGGAALLGFVLITKILPHKKSDRHGKSAIYSKLRISHH